MTIIPEDKAIIAKALQALSGICDGAYKQDTMGFNKVDSAFGKSLADQSLTSTLSDSQTLAAAKMLKKYKNQLEGFGIILPDALIKAASENKPEIWATGSRVYVSFPRRPSEEVLAAIRMVPGRNWNGQNWSFPVSSLEHAVKAIPEISEVTIQVEPEPVPAHVQDEQPAKPASADVLLSLENGYIVIRFGKGSDKFWENLGIVKSFGERRYDPEKKLWKTPQRMATQLLNVLKGNIEMAPELKAVIQVHTELAKMSNVASSEFAVPNLKPGNELLPFQRAGVEFIEKAKGRALLCDEMGLGKTMQALGWFALREDIPIAIVVCPASLKLNWKRETLKWLSNAHVVTLSGKPSSDFINTFSSLFSFYNEIWKNGFKKNENIKSNSNVPFVTSLCHSLLMDRTRSSARVNSTSNFSLKPGHQFPVRIADTNNPNGNLIFSLLDKINSTFTIKNTSDISQLGFIIRNNDTRHRKTTLPNSNAILNHSSAESVLIETELSSNILDSLSIQESVSSGDTHFISNRLNTMEGKTDFFPEVFSQSLGMTAKIISNDEVGFAIQDTIFGFMQTIQSDYFMSGHAKLLIIINYDILVFWKDILLQLIDNLIISDEIHLCKSLKSIRGKTLHEVGKKFKHVIGATGTVIVNRPVELFPVLNMIDEASWPKFTSFAYRYCEAGNNGWGWSANGASNLEELHELIKPFVIRRTKGQVLTELPAKRRASIIMQFDEKQRQAYWEALQAAKNSSKAAEALRLIEAAKQAAVKGKLAAAIDWIENFIETEKLVVFATHNLTVDALMAKFGTQAVKLTGAESLKEREVAVDRFQNDENVKLFVGNIIAAGTGITLTAASNVAFLEFAWTSGQMEQAIDRVHRIGQTDSVTAWFLIADNTIEEKLVELLNEKAKVLDIVHDGLENDAHQISILGELMNDIKKNHDTM